jgi:hypothetical protein
MKSNKNCTYFNYEDDEQKISNTNPFEFSYNTKKVNFGCNNIGKKLFARNIINNNCYLKCTFKIIFRSHSGYCSEQDNNEENYEDEKTEILKLYFNIPDNLKNNSGDIDIKNINDESNIIYNHNTKLLFKEWEKSSCGGECGYTDSYIPILFEYIKIT